MPFMGDSYYKYLFKRREPIFVGTHSDMNNTIINLHGISEKPETANWTKYKTIWHGSRRDMTDYYNNIADSESKMNGLD